MIHISKMGLCKVLCVIVIFGVVSAMPKVGDSFSLYKVTVQNVEQREAVSQLMNKLDLDVWAHPRPEKPGKILVPQHQKTLFENEFSSAGIEYQMIVKDVNELYEKERMRISEASRKKSNFSKNGSIDFDIAGGIDEVNSYLEKIATTYPNKATLENLFYTAEGRPINYLRISTSGFTDTNKPIILIQSLISGRDWISLPVAMNAVAKLTYNITEKDLSEDIDWIIIPVVNPDGYQFSRNITRHWVKNRINVDNECIGVNINRNFDISFGDTSSNNGCSNNYHGNHPFSERESQTVRNLAIRYAPRIRLFLDFQSFGSQILYGYGDSSYPADKLLLHYLGAQMANIMNAQVTSKNDPYDIGIIADDLNKESGIAIDHVKIEGNVPFSYTIKLPSYGDDQVLDDGFLIDPKYFPEVESETWEGIKVAARFIRDIYKN